MGNIKITLKSRLHPNDSDLHQKIIEVSKLDELGVKLIEYLELSMFANWRSQGRCYFPIVESQFEYLPTDNGEWDEILKAIEEDKREEKYQRHQTALDEAKTADLWAKSEPRYYVTVIASEFKKCQNVHFHLFHTKMSNDELAPLVVLAHDKTIDDIADGYTASAIEQTFSKAEVRQLHTYFSQFDNMRLRAHRAGPDNHCIGYGAQPVGGCDDFYVFPETDGYSLPFDVWGYYDWVEWEHQQKVAEGDKGY